MLFLMTPLATFQLYGASWRRLPAETKPLSQKEWRRNNQIFYAYLKRPVTEDRHRFVLGQQSRNFTDVKNCFNPFLLKKDREKSPMLTDSRHLLVKK